METTRRGFFGLVAGAAVAAVVSMPGVVESLPAFPHRGRLYFSQPFDPMAWQDPDDVFCRRCGCSQLPDHISASGYEYHTARGNVFAKVKLGRDGASAVPRYITGEDVVKFRRADQTWARL